MAKKRVSKKKVGRPTKDTPEVRRKIEEAAALDASVEEIAFYADISRDTFYEILKKDASFSDRIAALRQRPILAARQTVISKMTENYSNAMDYLKRKRKEEFSERHEVTDPNDEEIKNALDDIAKLSHASRQTDTNPVSGERGAARDTAEVSTPVSDDISPEPSEK